MRTMQFGTGKEQVVVDLLKLCDNDPDLLAKCQGDYGKNLHLAPKLKIFYRTSHAYPLRGQVDQGRGEPRL